MIRLIQSNLRRLCRTLEFQANLLILYVATTLLIPLLKRTPMKLSGGERQLLVLAMAILHQPKMILIDEPFNGLSPQNITFVREKLKILNEKERITFLIVEHRIKDVYVLARGIIRLKLGNITRIENVSLNYNFNAQEFREVFI